MKIPSGLRADVRFAVGRLQVEVQLEVEKHCLVIVGPNGSGKTSLLLSLLGVLPLQRGYFELGGTLLVDTEAKFHVPLEERHLAYVPQDYALLPHLDVKKNVLFALESSEGRSRAQHLQRVDELLSSLGILHLSDRRIPTLSGGERQKVALARALSVRPRALLLDEPLAALDIDARQGVRTFLAQYLKSLGILALIVTHDAADARALGQHILVLEAGRVTQQGSWNELVANPQSHFIEQFVGSSH